MSDQQDHTLNLEDLRPRARSIFEAICAGIRTQGYPPSVREIATAVGLSSSSTVKHHLDNLVTQGFLVRAAGRSRALEVNPQFVGLSTSDPSPTASPSPITEATPLNHQVVPLVGQIAAGTPIDAQQDVEDVFTIPTRFTGEGELFMLKVHGESMIEAAICDGDWVIVRRQNVAELGEIVAAMIDGEATVKTLARREGHIWLLPHNPAFAPIPGDNATILGKVVTVLRAL
ncbi:transcriptional repressor LexA [Varibaculum vaginae]|uniref:transcriptional repressor LexA n=1 Tax=Varibaculum vaginae TaxID=2364797 RepID=UPI000F08B986|nr:transcriptional repressor LexA [Varibaculum vaginae]